MNTNRVQLHQAQEVISFLPTQKIQAIKALREASDLRLGLKEAKDVIDLVEKWSPGRAVAHVATYLPGFDGSAPTLSPTNEIQFIVTVKTEGNVVAADVAFLSRVLLNSAEQQVGRLGTVTSVKATQTSELF